MPQLRAATVGRRIIRKRKRRTNDVSDEDEDNNNDNGNNAEGLDAESTVNRAETPITRLTPQPTPAPDAASLAVPVEATGANASGTTKSPRKRVNKKNAKPPTLSRNSSSASQLVTTTIEWPQYFKDLAVLFKALNLMYTFVCTRKHVATTFETLKAAVENSTKKPLEVEDIAKMKFLLPQSIFFTYVDEASVQVHVAEAGNKAGRREDLYFEQEAMENPKDKKAVEVLLFEFIDGELKRKFAPRKEGEPFRRLKDDELKMPVFSQAAMTKLIKKRNDKFTSAINKFLNICAERGEDALEALDEAFKVHVPVKTVTLEETHNIKPKVSALPDDIPAERDSIVDIVARLTGSEWYYSQIVPNGVIQFPAQKAIYGDLDFQLSQSLINALFNVRNITQIFSHQASALNDLYAGHHVIVSTSTSSGKSLIYQIPFLHELEQNPDCRAIYVFPTKALAQDQRKSLAGMVEFMKDVLGPVMVETYDGDTPMENRQQIREEARVIFTNPDMLHINILPNEEQWRGFLKNLRYVVVDELHVYNGLFGSHMSFIMRRLRRICAAVGNNKVKFIACSATVANPTEHMKTIFGIDKVRLTDLDGSPAGLKTFLCWNCPYRDPGDPKSGRVDPVFESARIFVELILRGVRTIAFCRVRKVCELMITAVKNELIRVQRQEVVNRVMSYRGGYTPQDRRRIENEMFQGRLMGIVATNALELGVDIGSLDAVIMVGFPYTISNVRQQSGRAGRRNKDSLSILVADAFPTDQYYMSNPELITTMPNPALMLDLENILILEGHIQCAAYEMPINTKEDAKYFGPQLKTLAEERLIKDDQGWFHCNDRFRPFPSRHVTIRDTEDGHFAVVDITGGRNLVLEEVEPSRAIYTLYEGGIFLHQGYKYMVKEFNPEGKFAKVEHVNVDWTTQQRDYLDIDPLETEAIRQIPNSTCKAFLGPIKIRAVVFGYFKIDKKRRILDAVEADNPPLEILSKGMWLDIPRMALDILDLKRLNIAGAIHAAEHAVLSLLPNFVMSTLGDVRTECKVPEKEFLNKESSRKRPARLTFYDAKGGASGSGISTKAFEFIDLLLQMALKRVDSCDCAEGCPECVCADRCIGVNAVLSKAGSSVILKSILNVPIDIDALPEGPEDLPGLETIVPAVEVKPGYGKSVETVVVKREPVEVNFIKSEPMD